MLFTVQTQMARANNAEEGSGTDQGAGGCARPVDSAARGRAETGGGVSRDELGKDHAGPFCEADLDGPGIQRPSAAEKHPVSEYGG